MAATGQSLEERLETGWRMIETARAESRTAEAERLTDHWLHLLKRYEEQQQARRNVPPPAPRQPTIW